VRECGLLRIPLRSLQGGSRDDTVGLRLAPLEDHETTRWLSFLPRSSPTPAAWAAFVLVAFAVGYGCSSVVGGSPTSSGTGAGDGSSTSSGAGGGGGSPTSSETGGGGGSSTSSGNGEGGGSSTSSGTGSAEPCSVNDPCDDGYYCVYDDHGCGQKQATGLCAPKNGGAGNCEGREPSCGCDGKKYMTWCDAAAAGVDTTSVDVCTPEGTVWCGGNFCRQGAEYCIASEYHDEQLGECVADYYCHPFPAECAEAPTCECILEAEVNLFAVTCNEADFSLYAINDC